MKYVNTMVCACGVLEGGVHIYTISNL